jgi:hypothetical protein
MRITKKDFTKSLKEYLKKNGRDCSGNALIAGYHLKKCGCFIAPLESLTDRINEAYSSYKNSFTIQKQNKQ